VFDGDESTRHRMNLSFLKIGGLPEHEGRANLLDCTLISRFSARKRACQIMLKTPISRTDDPSSQVRWEPETVRIELRPFNDAQLNRDLDALCTRVATAQPRLPDGRRLVFTVGPLHRLSSELYQQQLE
jgi:hypothetical protein